MSFLFYGNCAWLISILRYLLTSVVMHKIIYLALKCISEHD